MWISGAYGRGNPVKVEQVHNDNPERYDEPIGNQILGVSLDGITYVTRLHEWTIEYAGSVRVLSAFWGQVLPFASSRLLMIRFRIEYDVTSQFE